MISVGLFGVAAAGGAALATMHVKRTEPPLAIGVVHALLAATALVTLLLAVLDGSATGLARPALGAFVVAALGGFGLFALRLLKRPLPLALIAVHALVAVVGFGLLCAATFGGA